MGVAWRYGLARDPPRRGFEPPHLHNPTYLTAPVKSNRPLSARPSSRCALPAQELVDAERCPI